MRGLTRALPRNTKTKLNIYFKPLITLPFDLWRKIWPFNDKHPVDLQPCLALSGPRKTDLRIQILLNSFPIFRQMADFPALMLVFHLDEIRSSDRWIAFVRHQNLVNMSGIEFVIPINKEDLCSVGFPGQYVVDQTFSKNELPSKLRGKN